MEPAPGQVICGHLRIEEQADDALGATAFGPVLTAVSTEDPEPMWLTVVPRSLTPNQVALSKFMAGVGELCELGHRSLIQPMMVDRESDFVVVGYPAPSNARPLRDVIESDDGHPILARVAIEMARGLTFLHRHRRVHGALGPGTVLLVDGKVRLWQYGLAELCAPDKFAKQASKVGGDVIAPEIREGERPTAASDVFAWAVLVAGLASGCVGAEALLAVEDGAANFGDLRILKVLIDRAVSPDPSKRPADGLELLEALSQIGGADAKRAQTYYLEAHDVDGGANDADGAPSAVPEDRTPQDGMTAAAVREVERERQRVRQAQLEELERKKAKWGKAPPPIPIKTEPSKPPPPPSPKPVAPPVGQRDPSRPAAAVDQLGPIMADLNRIETTPKKERPKPVPRAVGDPSPIDSGAFRPAPDSSGTNLELDFSTRRRAADRPSGLRPDAKVAAAPAKKASSAAPTPRSISDVTRRPGPHGPRGPLMAAGIAVVGTAMALLATVGAAGATGGMSRILGLERAVDVDADADAAASPAAVDPNVEDTSKPAVDSDVAPAVVKACPDEMVELGPLPGAGARYCIDIAEHPGLREPPTTRVTLEEARRACEERGRRLCTTAEWSAACKGPSGRRFPYGNEHAQDRCNEAAPDGNVVDLTRSGARDKCVTESGLYDMAGNVSEWVAEGIGFGGDATVNRASCNTKLTLPRGSATPALGFRCCATVAGTGRPAGRAG